MFRRLVTCRESRRPSPGKRTSTSGDVWKTSVSAVTLPTSSMSGRSRSPPLARSRTRCLLGGGVLAGRDVPGRPGDLFGDLADLADRLTRSGADLPDRLADVLDQLLDDVGIFVDRCAHAAH